MNAQTLALFLRAVSLVESGGNPSIVGRHGERGVFQMTPAVVATCGGYREREAARWERQIERELIAAGIEPLPVNVYLAWNAGVGAVRRAQVPEVTYQRAVRVQNLMEKLNQGLNK